MPGENSEHAIPLQTLKSFFPQIQKSHNSGVLHKDGKDRVPRLLNLILYLQLSSGMMTDDMFHIHYHISVLSRGGIITHHSSFL